MITDIPTGEELREAGLNYLHMAWDIGLELYFDLKNASWSSEPDKEISDEYWRLSQPALGNAFTLLQQAQEFQLKSRIAKISPFLLLSREPKDWPKKSDRVDTPFSTFRTVDAADLVRINNTVAPTRISNEIAQFLDEVRRQRNVTIHFGTKGQRFDVSRLFVAALRTYGDLFEGKHWPTERIAYQEENRTAAAYSADYVGDSVLNEFQGVVQVLRPMEAKKYFGFDKKARRYICPTCMESAENERIALAQLTPNLPDADKVHCFVCTTETPIVRKSCTEKDCKSNVQLTDGTCLVCW